MEHPKTSVIFTEPEYPAEFGPNAQREAIERDKIVHPFIIAATNRQIITKGLQTVYLNPAFRWKSNSFFTAATKQFLTAYIDEHKAQQAIPPDTDLVGFSWELQKMNSPEFWTAVVGSIPPKALAPFVAREGRRTPAQLGETIAQSNRFMSRALALTGLAVLFGSDAQHYFTDLALTSSAHPSALKIAELYPTPIRRKMELYERLKTLFLEQSGEQPDSSLYWLLSESGGFQNTYKSRGADGLIANFTRPCAGIVLAKTIFEAYGRLLNNNRYQAAFMDRVK